MSDKRQNSSLKKNLGLLDNTLFGVGVILGAGIYAIIGVAAGMAGNMLWVSLLLAALAAILTAACYGELVSRFPDAGGGYEYIARAYGRRFALWIAVILFATAVVASAAIALSFGEYLARLVDVDTGLAATGLIVAVALVNILGVRHSATVNIIATGISLAGLLVVVGFAIPEMGGTDLLAMPDSGLVGVLGAAALAFFSYVGFEDVVKMAEETKEPRRTTPKALMVASIVVLIIYLAVAIAAVTVLDPQTLSGAEGPMAELAQTVWGKIGATIVVIAALFATTNSVLVNFMGNARLVYDLSRDTLLPSFFGYLLPNRRTPVVAIILIALTTWLFALIGDIGRVASISNLFILTLFLLVTIGLLRLRLQDGGEDPPPFRLPMNVGRVSVVIVAAIGLLVVLIGFNIYNLVTGVL